MEFRACRRRQRGLWTSVVLPGLMLRGRVTYQLLKEVTDNFSKEREIGAGASGKVFKVGQHTTPIFSTPSILNFKSF